MSAIAALLDSRDAVTYLRRTIPSGGPRVVSCRSVAAMDRLFRQRVVEAVVLSPRHPVWVEARRYIQDHFPMIATVLYGAFKPDDGELLLQCHREGVATLAVLGVDDPVVGDMVMQVSLSTRRKDALADAPPMLGLVEPLQVAVWNYVLAAADRPLRTEAMAGRFDMSREHLSRQFAAGGAPNLKRVVDLGRVVSAAQLLANPGYRPGEVAGLLGFSSSSHLSRTALRVADARAGNLGELAPQEILSRFVKGRTRSRL
jgi:AraC-like DNA-binding protein